MNLGKLITLLSLSSLLVMNTLNAAEPAKAKPAAKAQPQKAQSKAQPQAAAAPKKEAAKAKEAPKAKQPAQQKPANAAPADANLKRFNQNIGLNFTQRGVVKTKDNKEMVTLRYTIENRGKSEIKSVTWVGAYMVGNEAIFVQEIPLTFNKPLKAKAKEDITIQVPLANLPQKARQYFLSKDANIGVLNVARNVTFTDGKQINVD